MALKADYSNGNPSTLLLKPPYHQSGARFSLQTHQNQEIPRFLGIPAMCLENVCFLKGYYPICFWEALLRQGLHLRILQSPRNTYCRNQRFLGIPSILPSKKRLFWTALIFSMVFFLRTPCLPSSNLSALQCPIERPRGASTCTSYVPGLSQMLAVPAVLSP